MANVDLITGKINGAKEGTLKYYHEEGHLKFEEQNPKGNKIRVVQEVSKDFLLKICCLSIIAYPLWHTLLYDFIFWGIILLIVINSLSEIYEEKWCWSYAKREINNLKFDLEVEHWSEDYAKRKLKEARQKEQDDKLPKTS